MRCRVGYFDIVGRLEVVQILVLCEQAPIVPSLQFKMKTVNDNLCVVPD